MTVGFRFPKPVNMTQPSNVTSYLNTTTGGAYGSVLLLGIFILGIIVQRRADPDSLLASGFFTTLIATFFRLINFVDDSVVVAMIFITAGGFLISVLGRRPG